MYRYEYGVPPSRRKRRKKIKVYRRYLNIHYRKETREHIFVDDPINDFISRRLTNSIVNFQFHGIRDRLFSFSSIKPASSRQYTEYIIIFSPYFDVRFYFWPIFAKCGCTRISRVIIFFSRGRCHVPYVDVVPKSVTKSRQGPPFSVRRKYYVQCTAYFSCFALPQRIVLRSEHNKNFAARITRGGIFEWEIIFRCVMWCVYLVVNFN